MKYTNFLDLSSLIGVDGFLHCNELQKLAELAANKDVLEVGAYRGLSAWGMAISAKSVTSLDTFKSCSNGQRQESQFTTLDAYYSATKRFNNVKPPMIGTSGDLAPGVPMDSFDFIFIDAMHTYEEVRDDIQRWWPKLKPGGVMAFHDYRHHDAPDVEKAVDEIFGPAPEGTTEITLRWVTKP